MSRAVRACLPGGRWFRGCACQAECGWLARIRGRAQRYGLARHQIPNPHRAVAFLIVSADAGLTSMSPWRGRPIVEPSQFASLVGASRRLRRRR